MKKLTTLLLTGVLALSLAGCSTPSTPPAQNIPNPPVALTTTDTTVYAIKLNDNGTSLNSVQVGCGDSAMPVQMTAPNAYDDTDPVASINAAMMTLLSTTATSFNTQGYQNPLSNQAMVIQSVTQSGTNYTVKLNGSFTFGGVCDMPRVRAQVEETIKKAALTGNTFTIDWNSGGQAAWNAAFSQQ